MFFKNFNYLSNLIIDNLRMDLSKFINLYLEHDKKNISDDENIIFTVRDNGFSVGTFKDIEHYFWQKNRDAMISFIRTDDTMHASMIMYRNNIIEYSNYTSFSPYLEPNELHSDKDKEKEKDKEKFNNAFKNALNQRTINSMHMTFKSGLNANSVRPYIKIFCILLSLIHLY